MDVSLARTTLSSEARVVISDYCRSIPNQGRGLGRILIEQAENFCRDAGCRRMQIRVLNHRTELPPFYEKLGYRVSGIEEVEQEATARMPYHFIVMEKPL